ncbi:MAG: class I SAM-dependent methyltransferase [Methyloceanibacter sp.]|uniref:class I SAM-dependent methyltransferase n=1 Tax=Methyloceanibacter sp. TaxID=1965321 RepID=UPI003D9B69B6
MHHGRLFILLYLLSAPEERAFAVDVFSDQTRNVDESGRGNEAIFLSNLFRHAGGSERVELFACDSNQLRPEDIKSRVGRCRLISVDGGHTADTTENDLRLADALLIEGGVCILDDYFNPMWPDVSSGAARYFLSPGMAASVSDHP